MISSSPFANLDPVRQKIAYERAAQKVKELRESAGPELAAIQIALDRKACSTLKGFAQAFWPVVEPTIDMSWNWHLDELVALAESMERGEVLKAIVNVPPGTSKSLLLSVFLRGWIWSKDPSKRFLAGSYGGHLSIRDNVKLRAIITSPMYQTLFPQVKLTDDQNTKTKLETDKGGWSIATSVGGAGTGEHPDVVLLDDPLTEAQSRSDADRDAANSWIDRTISTRGVTRDVRTLLVMQRLHMDDPTGHLLAKGGWEHIVFPMRYEGLLSYPDGRKEIPDPRDRRTVKGELLWPELFPEHKVRALEIALGPYAAAGQLQQRPAPEGGGLFKREWLKFVELAPLQARRARGWDTAATEGGGDRTATCRIAELKSTFYIEHAAAWQLSPAGVESIMHEMAFYDGPTVVIRELQEPASSGKTVIEARTKTLKGYDHKGVRVTGDKITMAKPLRAQVEAGNVYIVRTGDRDKDSWIEPFIQELTMFPTGDYDDRVDAASCAFNSVLLEPQAVEEWATW